MSDQLPFKNIRIPNEPIILNTNSAEWHVDQHLEIGAQQVIKLLDEADEPCFYITDLRAVSMPFDEIVKAANMATRVNNAMLRHPNLREFLIVTHNKLMGMAGKGLSADIFGNIRVRVFVTVEAALDYAREQIAPGSS